MKRSNTKSKFDSSNPVIYRNRVAYHEAGHAAAIHLNNRLKKLPPVFFKIQVAGLSSGTTTSSVTVKPDLPECIARIEGGRLIESLPFSLDTIDPKAFAGRDTTVFNFTDGFHPAFEADIVNLLIGPLAEAKYVAVMDGETFDVQLFTVQSLKNYGGEADLAVVYDYLGHYTANQQLQEQSLAYFLSQAFEFVDHTENWKAIIRLAHYILTSHSREISCERVAGLLDTQ